MKSRNGARVIISIQSLMDILQFKNGILHSIKLHEPYLPIRDIEMVIEHPDLPKVRAGEMLVNIVPEYRFAIDKAGNVVNWGRVKPIKKAT